MITYIYVMVHTAVFILWVHMRGKISGYFYIKFSMHWGTSEWFRIVLIVDMAVLRIFFSNHDWVKDSFVLAINNESEMTQEVRSQEWISNICN